MQPSRIRLRSPLPAHLAPQLEERVFFVSSSIEHFELEIHGGLIHAVNVQLSPGAGELRSREESQGTLERQLNELVEQQLLQQRLTSPSVIWHSRRGAAEASDSFPELVRRGIAFEAGEGQVGYGEPLIALTRFFDERLRQIAMGLENAREYRYPTLLPTHVLERFGYFASFPQFVMFVTRLHSDADVYRSFTEQYKAQGAVPKDVLGLCRNHDYCLPPTMCYHTYHQFDGRVLGSNVTVTSRGKAFRFESRYCATMKRLWDFTIREIVFMGSPGFVDHCRAAVMQEAFAFMDELGLSGTCEAANDLFFGSEDVAAKALSQRMRQAKYELRLAVSPTESIAAGSFNIHGSLFGEAFRIRDTNEALISSGCVGFGLERLVYAFLCQHGLDRERWPACVQAALNDE